MPLPNPPHYLGVVTIPAANTPISLTDLLLNHSASLVKYIVDGSQVAIGIQSSFNNGGAKVLIGTSDIGTGTSPSATENWGKMLLSGMAWEPDGQELEGICPAPGQQLPSLGSIWLISDTASVVLGIEIHQVFQT